MNQSNVDTEYIIELGHTRNQSNMDTVPYQIK